MIINKFVFSILSLLIIGGTSYADVIIRDDGTIYLGRIKSVDSKNMVIENFGKDVSIPTVRVLKNEKTIDTLSKKKVNIILKDGSVISGKIDNFDDEIGILLNIGFGVITIPTGAVDEIRDTELRKAYSGNEFRFGAGAGMYFMTGSLAESYGPSFTADLYAEMNMPFRGLMGGIDISWNMMDYTPDDNMNYRMFAMKPYLMYVFLDFKKTASVFDKVNPFAAIYTGIAYVSLEDKRDYVKTSSLSEIDPDFMITAGFDYSLTENISLRISGGYRIVLQSTNSFQNTTASAGVNYGF